MRPLWNFLGRPVVQGWLGPSAVALSENSTPAERNAKQTPVWNFFKSTSVVTIRNVDENNTLGVLGFQDALRPYKFSGLSAQSSQALRV